MKKIIIFPILILFIPLALGIIHDGDPCTLDIDRVYKTSGNYLRAEGRVINTGGFCSYKYLHFLISDGSEWLPLSVAAVRSTNVRLPYMSTNGEYGFNLGFNLLSNTEYVAYIEIRDYSNRAGEPYNSWAVGGTGEVQTVTVDPCDGVSCQTDEYCHSGICVPIPTNTIYVDSCDGVVCADPDNEYCNNGVCIDKPTVIETVIQWINPCIGVNCPATHYCDQGACIDKEIITEFVDVPYDNCEGITCNIDQYCSNGVCVNIPINTEYVDSCEDVVCVDPSTEYCNNGVCIDKPTVIETVIQEVNPCFGVNCPVTHYCDDGACIEIPINTVTEYVDVIIDPCEGITCITTQYCDNGVCIEKPIHTEIIETTIIQEVDPCNDVTCVDTQYCSAGSCVDKPITNIYIDLCEGITCDETKFCSAGQCVFKPVTQEYVNICTGVTCQGNSFCDGTTGTCLLKPERIIVEEFTHWLWKDSCMNLCNPTQFCSNSLCYEKGYTNTTQVSFWRRIIDAFRINTLEAVE